MKATVLHQYNGDFDIEDVEIGYGYPGKTIISRDKN